jgi:hypothetical protein
VGIIAGATIGAGILLIFFFIALVFFLYRRRKGSEYRLFTTTALSSLQGTAEAGNLLATTEAS